MSPSSRHQCFVEHGGGPAAAVPVPVLYPLPTPPQRSSSGSSAILLALLINLPLFPSSPLLPLPHTPLDTRLWKSKHCKRIWHAHTHTHTHHT